MTDLSWTEEQALRIRNLIDNETENFRVAHKIIPEVPIAANARYVPSMFFNYAAGTVDDVATVPVDPPNEVPFNLTKEQAEDPDLSSAIVIIRRAVQTLCQNHDAAVFQGAIRGAIANGGPGFHNVCNINAPHENNIIAATAGAISLLDGQGYSTGYVMVAGQNVYRALHTRPAGVADIPFRAVEGLLEGGPIQRVGPNVLDPDEALILCVGDGHIDRAVAAAPRVEFLRIGPNNQRQLRVFERFVTRFKETLCGVLLHCI